MAAIVVLVLFFVFLLIRFLSKEETSAATH
jgi:hypothetical protein